MEGITTRIENGNNRIIRLEDGSLAPQRLNKGSWQYEYYQDGSPVVVPFTEAGLEECENWAGLWVNTSLNPKLKSISCSIASATVDGQLHS